MKSFLIFSFACFWAIESVAQTYKSYTPSRFPDRVILGWQADPATSQSVNWRTDSTVTQGVGMIREASATPDHYNEVTTVSAISESVVIEGKRVMYHSLLFKDLKPATQYSYRVGAGEQWSEWFHFKTAHNKPAPFAFLYFGDAQNDIRSMWSRTIRGAYSAMPSVNLMIHAGDLITTANADWQWGEWFEAGGWINGMVPTLATPGNHEYFRDATTNKYRITTHWQPQFSQPENGPEELKETAYYVDYQGVRFISLDSQGALLDTTILHRQATWLVQVLTQNPNRWTIVTHHHPVYSTKSGRDNVSWRDKMEPIYKKHGVDLVLQGHDHTYGRGLNMPLGNTRKRPDGPIYVVSVSGPKMYDIGLQDWMDRAGSNVQLYQIIRIDSDKLFYDSYTVTGQRYDAFELTKGKNGRNTLKDIAPNLAAEQLELPADFRKRYTPQQLEEYENRYQNYKKRKQTEKP